MYWTSPPRSAALSFYIFRRGLRWNGSLIPTYWGGKHTHQAGGHQQRRRTASARAIWLFKLCACPSPPMIALQRGRKENTERTKKKRSQTRSLQGFAWKHMLKHTNHMATNWGTTICFYTSPQRQGSYLQSTKRSSSVCANRSASFIIGVTYRNSIQYQTPFFVLQKKDCNCIPRCHRESIL